MEILGNHIQHSESQKKSLHPNSSWMFQCSASQTLTSTSPEPKSSSHHRQWRHHLVKIAILSPPAFFPTCLLPWLPSPIPLAKISAQKYWVFSNIWSHREIQTVSNLPTPDLKKSCVFKWWPVAIHPSAGTALYHSQAQNCQGSHYTQTHSTREFSCLVLTGKLCFKWGKICEMCHACRWCLEYAVSLPVSHDAHTAQVCQAHLPHPVSNLSPLAPATTGAGDRGQVGCWGDKGWCPKRPPLELTVQFLISSWFTTSGVIIAITIDVITEHLLWAMNHPKFLKYTTSFYAHGSLLGGRNPHLYMRELEHRGVKSLNYSHMIEAGRTRLKTQVCLYSKNNAFTM